MTDTANIRLTRADVVDLDPVLVMVRDFHAHDHLPFDPVVVRRILETLIANDSLGRLFLVRSDEDVVGYVVLGFGFSIEYLGRDAFVDELFLVESWRGRGVGRRVLSLLQSEARRLGLGALHLEVTRGNTRALALYASSGFRDSDRTMMTWWTD